MLVWKSQQAGNLFGVPQLHLPIAGNAASQTLTTKRIGRGVSLQDGTKLETETPSRMRLLGGN